MGLLSRLKGKFRKEAVKCGICGAMNKGKIGHDRCSRCGHILDTSPMPRFKPKPRPRIRDTVVPIEKPQRAIHQDHSKFFKRRKGQSLEYYKTTKKKTKKEELDEL